jgi:hypothetical protein
MLFVGGGVWWCVCGSKRLLWRVDEETGLAGWVIGRCGCSEEGVKRLIWIREGLLVWAAFVKGHLDCLTICLGMGASGASSHVGSFTPSRAVQTFGSPHVSGGDSRVCLRTHGCDLGAPFVALLAHTESLDLIHEYLACPVQEKAFEILEDCPLKQPSSAAVLAAQEVTRSHVGRHEFRQGHRDGVQGAMAFIGRVRDGTVCLCEAQSCRLPLTSTTSMCWTQWCRAGLRMIKRLSIYVPTRLMRRQSCNDKTTPCCSRCSSHAIEMQCRHIAPAFESIFQSLIPFSLTSHLFTRGPSSNSHAIVSLVGRLLTQVSSTSILPITRRI